MNIKCLNLLICCVLLFAVFAGAQEINTISYVPVKNGYYQKITTKSDTSLAQDIGDVSFATLKANSSKFTIETRKLTFGKPVIVKSSVFSNGAVVVAVKNRVAIDGIAQVNGIIEANKSQGAVSVEATNINMPTRRVDVTTGTIYVDGIPIPNPNCTLEWRSVNAKNTIGVDASYQLLACHGSGGGSGGGGGGSTFKECSASTKPSNYKDCGTCGVQYRGVSCNNTTGQWVIASDWGDCQAGYHISITCCDGNHYESDCAPHGGHWGFGAEPNCAAVHDPDCHDTRVITPIYFTPD